jgi:hypothetical protein
VTPVLNSYQFGVNRDLVEGETAIISFEGQEGWPPCSVVVQRFLSNVYPEGAVEILRRPRRGDLIRQGEKLRPMVVRAAKAAKFYAAFFAVEYKEGFWGQAHCSLCRRDFWARDRYNLEHECEGKLPKNWAEAMVMAEKMDKEEGK